MDVTFLLCDAAEAVNGKLYVLGGGWSVVHGPGPYSMALAIKIEVPWNQANQRHRLGLTLLTADGPEVVVEKGPVRLEGEIEVGRPAGLKPGSPIDAVFAIRADRMPLEVGGYRWEMLIDGTKVAERSFQVLG